MADFSIPLGYSFAGLAAGLKGEGLPDLGVIFSDRPATAAAMFTRNRVQGAPLQVGREHLAAGAIRAVVVNSKNSNVATGPQGVENCRRVCRSAAAELGLVETEVFPSSTGVIGRQLPVEKLTSALAGVQSAQRSDSAAVERFAAAILTTDTRIKIRSRAVAGGTVLGVAKGAGMIEPNMATMLAYILTDLELPAGDLKPLLAAAVDDSFHCATIDSDTSTSDTVLLLANGASGKKISTADERAAFEAALRAICVELAREVVRDGEGVQRIITVRTTGALSKEQARMVGKSAANSPLVKTAVAGADPNWGRLMMAVGKTFDETIQADRVRLWGVDPADGREVDLMSDDEAVLAELRRLMRGSEVIFRIDLGLGSAACEVWGCDLTKEYISINADYTT